MPHYNSNVSSSLVTSEHRLLNEIKRAHPSFYTIGVHI